MAVEAWGRLTLKWAWSAVPTSYNAAGERAGQVEGYVKQYPAAPLVQRASAYLDYLNEGLAAAAPDGPWKKSLRELLANPLLHDLQTLQTSSGRRFYVLPDKADVRVARLDGRVTSESFDAVLSPDLTKIRRVTLRRDDLLRDLKPAASPQATYAATLLDAVDKLDYADWDLFGIRAMATLLADRDMNPVVQGILAKNLLHFMQPTLDWLGDGAVEGAADAVGGDEARRGVVGEPGRPGRRGRGRRRAAAPRAVAAGGGARRAVRQKRAAACSVAQIAIDALAVALKDGDGWQVNGGTGASETGYVVDGNNALVQAFRRVDGRWRADPAAGVVDGQLVFLAPPPK